MPAEIGLVVKRIFISSLLFLLGGVIGIVGGVGLSYMQSVRQRKAFETPQGRRFVATYVTMSTLQLADLRTQLRDDKPDAKKAKLLSELQVIDDIKKNLANTELLPLVEVQEGIVHGQLALMEESSGNTDAVSEQMSAAREAFKAAGWTDYSESHVREIIEGVQGSPKDQRKPGGQK